MTTPLGLVRHFDYQPPVVHGKDILTTRSNYVNKYLSTVQTTSYNFTSTETTGSTRVGVVKAPKVHLKNPAQHAAGTEELEKAEQLHPVFVKVVTRKPKSVECVRVDGAADEDPAYEEVQFWWAAPHIAKSR